MLVLAGAGYKAGMLTREVENLLRRADKVYVDTYTSPGASNILDYVKAIARSSVVAASRDDLEGGSQRIISEASRLLVVILVPGDPLIATTHVALLAEARRAGIEARYYPGVSGVCAAKAASMLHYYRFGRTVTVPGPWRGVKPYSLVAFIYSNLCAGLHTLALLDVRDDGLQLRPEEAAETIITYEREVAKELGLEPFLGELPALAVEAGGEGAHRVYGFNFLKDLARARLPEGVYSLVLPAELHPTEAWALEEIYKIKLKMDVYSAIDWDKVCSSIKHSPRGPSLPG